MSVLAALLLTVASAPAPAPQYSTARSPVFAPRGPVAKSPRRRPSRTSRVRAWTVEQRYCEHRRNGSCIMTAPDLLKPDVAAKAER
jgi:hypothetical protein